MSENELLKFIQAALSISLHQFENCCRYLAGFIITPHRCWVSGQSEFPPFVFGVGEPPLPYPVSTGVGATRKRVAGLAGWVAEHDPGDQIIGTNLSPEFGE